ncbi:MAG: integrase arm-type DNA-binding domain-containing protein [Hyphomicrobium sp.]
MRRLPLTDLAIQKLKAPDVGQVELFDAKAPGLSIRVGSTGVKSFFLTYRLNGERKRRRGKLGRYGEMSLSAARGERLAKLAQAAKGSDPFGASSACKIDLCVCGFEACVERFIAQYVRPNSKTPDNPIRILRNEFVAAWKGRDVRSLAKADVLKVLHAIRERGAPVAANRALSRIRKLFTWLIEQDAHALIKTSPCLGLKPLVKERSRERVLSQTEVAALWLAADGLGYPYGSYFKLLTLLGQRRTEIASIRWDELDLSDENEALWKIPSSSTKNGEAHVLPLPRAAVDILRDCPRISGSPFVFPSAHDHEKYLSGFTKWKNKIDAVAGVHAWTPHDLRRTQASVAPSLGLSEVLIEQIHNHKLPNAQVSVSGKIYNRYRYVPEMRAALEAYASYIFTAVANNKKSPCGVA